MVYASLYLLIFLQLVTGEVITQEYKIGLPEEGMFRFVHLYFSLPNDQTFSNN